MTMMRKMRKVVVLLGGGDAECDDYIGVGGDTVDCSRGCGSGMGGWSLAILGEEKEMLL